MERKHRPTSISMSAALPQPTVTIDDTAVTASLPSGDSVKVYLYGATVTSWKTAGREQLFLSTAADLTGKKPIRGGIPLVFPVFGPPPKNHATSALPQHGFARNSVWEFLGKTTSESASKKEDESVQLDFGLSRAMLSEENRGKWRGDYGMVYSVTLTRGKLKTGLHVQNKGEEGFEFQTLFHSYFNVDDISKTTVGGLKEASYVDKVRQAKTFTEENDQLSIKGETDRVYTTPEMPPVVVSEGGKEKFRVLRESLPDVTVWNGWEEKIGGMGDFEPKDGWKRYICIEPGSVSGWIKLEAGDAWEGSCVVEAKL